MSTMILNLDGTPVKDFSNPDRKVMWSKRDIWGGRVYGSLRSIAHLDQTSKRSVKRFGQEIEVIQGAYNDDVDASAGTHDYDAVFDIFIPNVDWWLMQRWLRWQGWAAWYRYPPTFGRHIHMISLGYQTRVGEFVPGQVYDYYHKRNGLAGHAYDGTARPDDIDATIFHFAEWEREMREHMELTEDNKQWFRETIQGIVSREVTAAVKETVDALLSEEINPEEETVRGALRSAKNSPELIRALAKGLDVDLTPTSG